VLLLSCNQTQKILCFVLSPVFQGFCFGFCDKNKSVRDFPENMLKNPFAFMSLRIARGVYNPEKDRFHYYVSFKPTLDPTTEERGAGQSYLINVALSVTETGELADLTFSLPENARNRRSLEYLSRTASASVVNERVFITVPDLSGDSVLEGRGNLELDGFGRIIGLEIS
jgi:hypothetical protein